MFVVFRKVVGEVASTEDGDGDDDVYNERQRVMNGDADSECLRLVNLTKVRVITCYSVFLNIRGDLEELVFSLYACRLGSSG